MMIPLTPEIEDALTEQARREGTTPERLACDMLRDRVVLPGTSDSAISAQETLADYLAEHLGVVSSSEHVAGGARMSEDCGKKFAAGLLQKQQQGHR